jgi:hypothetical protein
MKQFLILCILFFVFSQQSNSQSSLSDYAYVLVPQQFEFQRGKDQYQINTLMRHLFNSAGFNAIYDEELRGLSRCDGLFADLIRESSFLQTKIQIVLKDCYNNIVYRSAEGTSKEKEYRKGYHEAIRRAFQSIEVLSIKQGDLNAFREKNEKQDAAFTVTKAIDVKPKSISAIEINSKLLSKYIYKEKAFYLEATTDGYILYEKRGDDFIKAGALSKTTREGMYLFNKDGKSMLANFDSDKNLLIDGVDSNGTPTQNKYTKVKEE